MRLHPVAAAVGRVVLVLVVCAASSVAMVALSRAVGPERSPAAGPPPRATQDRITLPPLSELRVSADRGPATPKRDPQRAAPVRDRKDPLARWAARTARLLAVPKPALVGFAKADLAMQKKAPGCHLSWITLAAIGHLDPQGAPARDRPLGALATAKELCAGGRDTSTEAGWLAAVRSLGNSSAYTHRVLAVTTVYASVLASGDPLSPPVRAALDFAVAKIGLPYVWGGNGPRRGDAGFDCSGLTTAAYAAGGVDLPRTAHTQYFATERVSELRPGDLLFYGNPNTKIHHVGLYIGGGQMINAPSFGQRVQVEPYRWPGDDLTGAGRPT